MNQNSKVVAGQINKDQEKVTKISWGELQIKDYSHFKTYEEETCIFTDLTL